MNILITGASGDIGIAIAAAFQQVLPTTQLLLHCHKAEEDFSAPFANALVLRYDLREQAQVAAMFAEIESTVGTVDILINNCGISGFSQFQDITTAAWRDMLAVNLDASFLCCRQALPSMLAKKAGAIVNISSIWGQVGASCEVHYSAAKGGLIAMTKALAKEVAPSGIRVNCVAPGLIDTKMNRHLNTAALADFCSDIPMGRAGQPAEVATAVRFLALEGSYITGQVLGVSGGLVV